MKAKIICISDYGKKLLERYYARDDAYQRGFIKGRATNKNGKEIVKMLK
jgi:hypothetical protein